MALGPPPDDFFVQSRLCLVHWQPGNWDAPRICLCRKPALRRLRRQARQVHSNLPFVLSRQQQAVGNAQEKQHVFRVQVPPNIRWKKRASRQIGSILGVAAIYFCMNLSLIGVVPWRDFVPADKHPESQFIFAHFMERVHGSRVASVFTAMILWTAFGSCFALMLGYSRIPFAAARDGYFFKIFGLLHPTKNFPHISLLVVGAISIVCSFFALDTLINILLTTRILVQFIGQIGAVMLLRKRRPDLDRPYRIYLYPLPALLALVGWLYLFATSGREPILIGLATLVAGVIAFLIWSRAKQSWPFAISGETAKITTSGPGSPKDT